MIIRGRVFTPVVTMHPRMIVATHPALHVDSGCDATLLVAATRIPSRDRNVLNSTCKNRMGAAGDNVRHLAGNDKKNELGKRHREKRGEMIEVGRSV